jgi:uncharacterized membrane protein YccC
MRTARRLWAWLRRHDPGLGALRRAGRTAIVMPAMFALGDKVVGDATLATFAAFGSFAMLLLVDFGGPVRDRVQAHLMLVGVGAVFVTVGTLANRTAWLAAVAMAVVAFVVLFAGVVSSVLASASTALLLSFILPVTFAGPVSSLPTRLLGWLMAGVAGLLAIMLLWPQPARSPLRGPAIAACLGLAARLRSDAAYLVGGPDAPSEEEHREVAAASDEAVAALRRTFLATPYRPTGLSTPARTLVRLVDELSWLNAIVVPATLHPPGRPVNPLVLDVKLSVAALLEESAHLLADPSADVDAVRAELDRLRSARGRLEDAATTALPLPRLGPDLVTSLEPSFRAQELSFAASQIAENVSLTVVAERRRWLDRVLGHQPGGLSGPLAAAQERAVAHADRHSVWLHNSIRGAIALGLAVLVADLSGVQHSFWVVLATLSVLRSNALNIGQNAVRGLGGTVIGFIIGAALLAVIGTSSTVLWVLLPFAILVAGIAPAAISFAAGQAAFTVTLVILFNIIAPAGWRVGLVRLEDIAIGCLVSLVVGLLFWPRGAASALRQALAEAYTDTAHYLSVAVEFGMQRCEARPAGAPAPVPPTAAALRAAAAARRLDDTFRSFLAERGAKPVPMSDAAGLVSGVVGLRLAADAVLDLWQRDHDPDAGDRQAAREELLRSSAEVERWYARLADSFISDAPAWEPMTHDPLADGRLLAAVRRDLQGPDGSPGGTAARMIWTGDHLDAARRLQSTLRPPRVAPAPVSGQVSSGGRTA